MGFAGAVSRIFWLMGGNIALFMLAVFIFDKKTYSVFDIAFWAIVIGLILVRYIDITRLKGLTSNSEPATLKHWRIYVVKLIVASAALWGLAHGIPYLTGR
ncbi:MAG: hypothetical protein PHD74_06470 [Candidatus Krumholzibacteria bacterium]|nr:hypothetical protein [Candidatus Krumholzibacteria bacterium]